jgi:DNA replication protein DnaC
MKPTREEFEAYVSNWIPDEFGVVERPMTWEEYLVDYSTFQAAAAQTEARIVAESTDWLTRFGVKEHKVESLKSLELESTPAIEATAGDHWITVLSGGTGSGKTMAAVYWLRERVRDDAGTYYGLRTWTPNWWDNSHGARIIGTSFYGKRPPVFVTAAELSRVGHYDAQAVAKLTKAPYLVIDDLGVEYLDKNGFYASLLGEIVDERYEARRPTIYSTNLSVALFKERYGERFADRIREAGRFMNVTIPSLRKGPKAA